MTTAEARQSLLDRFDKVPFDQVRDVAAALEILVNVEKKEKELDGTKVTGFKKHEGK